MFSPRLVSGEQAEAVCIHILPEGRVKSQWGLNKLSFCRIVSPLRDHLMVGCDSLKVVILVRIQVPQLFNFRGLKFQSCVCEKKFEHIFAIIRLTTDFARSACVVALYQCVRSDCMVTRHTHSAQRLGSTLGVPPSPCATSPFLFFSRGDLNLEWVAPRRGGLPRIYYQIYVILVS